MLLGRRQRIDWDSPLIDFHYLPIDMSQTCFRLRVLFNIWTWSPDGTVQTDISNQPAREYYFLNKRRKGKKNFSVEEAQLVEWSPLTQEIPSSIPNIGKFYSLLKKKKIKKKRHGKALFFKKDPVMTQTCLTRMSLFFRRNS